MLEENRGLILAGGAIVVLRPNDKMPTESNWTQQERWTWDEAKKKFPDGCNIGVRLGKPSQIDGLYLFGVDLDIRSTEPRHLEEAIAAVARHIPEYNSLAVVISGSGGPSRHLYGLSEEEPRTKKLASSPDKIVGRDGKSHSAWELDIGGTGRQFVLPPSIHPITRKLYRWEAGRPPNWHDLTIISTATMRSWVPEDKLTTKQRDTVGDDLAAWYAQQPRHFSTDEIAWILDTLASHSTTRRKFIDDYDGWLHVGMALHHQSKGAEWGFEQWCDFAADYEEFDEDEHWFKWKSFGKRSGGKPLTMATLQSEAKNIEIAASTGSLRPDTPIEMLPNDFIAPNPLPDDADIEDDNPVPFRDDWMKALKRAEREMEEEHDFQWRKEFDRSEKTDHIKTNVNNVSLIVANDWRLKGWLAYNEFTGEQVQREELKRRSIAMMDLPQRDFVGGDNLSKEHEHNLRLFLAKPPIGKNPGYGMNPTDRDLKTAIVAACRNNRFHPIRNYLNGRRWDGVPRIETMFIRFLGTPDDQYHRDVATMIMVAGVARVFEPGCKFDHAVILEGKEGLRKSSFIREIAARPQWFGELHGDFGDRKGLVEQMQGNWQIEMPELSGFGRSAVLKVKAFMSARSDNVRLAYEARSAEFLRQCILWGSTNDRQYLQSETGERRFWPVEVRIEIDTYALRAVIDQIWAEAVHIYRTMRAGVGTVLGPGKELPLFLKNPEAKALAFEYQGSRKVETVSDILLGQIEALVNTPAPLASFLDANDKTGDLDTEKYIATKICAAWLHERLGQQRPISREDTSNYNIAMQKLRGWEPARLHFGSALGQQRGFKRKSANDAELRRGYMRET